MRSRSSSSSGCPQNRARGNNAKTSQPLLVQWSCSCSPALDDKAGQLLLIPRFPFDVTCGHIDDPLRRIRARRPRRPPRDRRCRGVSLSASTIGVGSVAQGTVTVAAAPVTAASVTLTSSNPAVASVQSPVTIPAGASTATFTDHRRGRRHGQRHGLAQRQHQSIAVAHRRARSRLDPFIERLHGRRGRPGDGHRRPDRLCSGGRRRRRGHRR